MGFLYFRDFCGQVQVWHLPRKKNHFKNNWPRKPPAFTQDTCGHKHSYSATGNEP